MKLKYSEAELSEIVQMALSDIASMQVGRRIVRGDAVMVLSIDDPIPPALLATINGINGIQEAHPVTL